MMNRSNVKHMKRLAALLLSLLMLLSMNGCMSLYLLSEQIDPDGTLLAEETVMPQVVIRPQKKPRRKESPSFSKNWGPTTPLLPM